MNFKQQSFIGTLKQDFSLSMNDYSQMSNIHKNTNNAFLLQKIQLLELELEQYKQKETQNKKLNQSIINTYNKVKHDNVRDKQSNNANISQLMLKHKQQIRKIKNQCQKQKLIVQNELKIQKQKKKKLQVQLNQLRVQKQKSLFQQKVQLQEAFDKKLFQVQEKLMTRVHLMEQSIQQHKRIAGIYKQHLYLRNMNGQNQNNQLQQNSSIKNKANIQNKFSALFNNKLSIEFQQQEKHKIFKSKSKSISSLNKKVSRALRQIHADRKKQLKKTLS